MKTLALMRHANAAPASDDGSDKHRALTDKGIQAIHATKPQLIRAHLNPDLVLCSPATRCKQTLEHLAQADMFEDAFLQEEPRLYNAAPSIVFDLIHDISNSFDAALIIAHNPAMQQLALSLTGTGDETLIEALRGGFPTFGCALIHFDVSQWQDICLSSGLLEHFITPTVRYDGASGEGAAFFKADYNSI